MRTKKVVLDYSDFKDHELNTMAGKVLDCLDGHTSFTDVTYYLRVRARNKRGIGDWSEVVSLKAR